MTEADASRDGTAGARPQHRRRALLPVLLWGAALALGFFVRPGTPEPTFLQTLLLPVWGALLPAAAWATWRAARPRGGGERRETERRRETRRGDA